MREWLGALVELLSWGETLETGYQHLIETYDDALSHYPEPPKSAAKH